MVFKSQKMYPYCFLSDVMIKAYKQSYACARVCKWWVVVGILLSPRVLIAEDSTSCVSILFSLCQALLPGSLPMPPLSRLLF